VIEFVEFALCVVPCDVHDHFGESESNTEYLAFLYLKKRRS